MTTPSQPVAGTIEELISAWRTVSSDENVALFGVRQTHALIADELESILPAHNAMAQAVTVEKAALECERIAQANYTYGVDTHDDYARRCLEAAAKSIRALAPISLPEYLAERETSVKFVGADGYDQKSVDVILNLSMLVRRLAHKHPNEKLKAQAIDYLNGEGLQGSVLREDAPLSGKPEGLGPHKQQSNQSAESESHAPGESVDTRIQGKSGKPEGSE